MDRVYEHVDVTDLMREWVDLGDREQNPYMKFMAYWVAFNMHYAPYKRRDEEGAERKAIERYCLENEARLGQYDPFTNGDAEQFWSLDLFKLYDWSERRVNKERQDIEGGDVAALMRAVYTVRCNFFHGNKRLGDQTDREFVTSAATIVRGYLGTLDFIPAL